MKMLIFLLILGGAVAFLVWRVQKSQAEAEQARRAAVERRKKKDSAALKQDTEKVWPVIIRPVTGKGRAEDEEVEDQPMMTSIEFEPSSTPEEAEQDLPKKTSA